MLTSLNNNTINKIRFLLSRKEKILLIILAISSVIVSLFEIVSLSLIMLFIQSLIFPKKIFQTSYLNFIYHWFNFPNVYTFIIVFGIFLILFFIIKTTLNCFYIYALSKFSLGRYYKFAYSLFKKYLSSPYIKFIQKPSAQIIKNINVEANLISFFILAVLLLLSEFITVLFIYGFLLYLNFYVTMVLTIFLILTAFFLKKFVFNRIKLAGKEREFFQSKFFHLLTAFVGNFKIIKLKGNEKELESRFSKSALGFTNAQIINNVLSQIPRPLLEGLSFIVIITIVLFLLLTSKENVQNIIPLLAGFIIGLYKMLPSLNRIITSYNQILFYRKALEIVCEELYSQEEEKLGDEEIDFEKEIRLENIYFHYIPDKPVLRGITLKIKKGEKIGFAGESGAGKSTLIDIIIGLYKPVQGKILIDGKELNAKNLKSWRKKIGYVPQQIYLIDGTVAENVAFGEKIDEKKIKEVLRKANILEFFEKYHEGIYTMVGENGVKLSGGQKQRIAIARAIYNDPEILVFDEATSSLDTKTEEKIMKEIYEISKNKTLIIIAHRLSTLDNCDKIVYIKDGKIERIENRQVN